MEKALLARISHHVVKNPHRVPTAVGVNPEEVRPLNPENIRGSEVHFSLSGEKCRLVKNMASALFSAITLLMSIGLQCPAADIAHAVKMDLRVVPSFEAASFYAKYDGWPAPAACVIEFRRKGDARWINTFPPSHVDKEKLFKGSVVNLVEDADYELRATLLDIRDAAIGSATFPFKTWNSTPPIARVINVRNLPKGPLNIDGVKGSPDGWIKYLGDGGTVIEGGDKENQAVFVKASAYLIFENLKVIGGKRHGFHLSRSSDIRIINCEISGYGRTGTQKIKKDGKYYDEKGRPINNDAGVCIADSGHVVVERCFIHDPRGAANAWRYSHPAGPNAIYIRATGGTVVRYNDFIGSDRHRWNDVIEGYENGEASGGFARDADIYGNMLAFGNDDCIELDGGQMNVRLYKNRLEGSLCGVSVAPCILGPSYIFRNLITDLGDEDHAVGAAIKCGGGGTFSHGRINLVHNTCVTRGSGIAGCGFGYDQNRAMFLALSRDNIICTSSPIIDSAANPDNDFDYDLLSNLGDNVGLVRAAPGAEKHAIIATPAFRNQASGDFRLADNSRGRGEATAVDNFSIKTLDDKADMGAFDDPSLKFLPFRPIPLVPDKTRIAMTADLKSGSLPTAKLTIKVDNADKTWTRKFRVAKNDPFDWLTVTPATGVFKKDDTVEFTVGLDPSKLTPGLKKAIFLVRLEDGYSVPVSCYISVYGHAFEKSMAAREMPGADAFAKVEDPGAVHGHGSCLSFGGSGKPQKVLTLDAEIPADGDYYLFARVKCPNPIGAHDSMFIAIDNGPLQRNDIYGMNSWHWASLSGEGGGRNYYKYGVRLARGRHTIKLAPREPLFLDAVFLTSDPVPPET